MAEETRANEISTELGPAQEPAFKIIGTRPVRPDGLDKVTGRAVYGIDMRLPGLLYGKVLRSPHAHARIRSIDTCRARALPGVKAVVTAADLPTIAGDPAHLDDASFALYCQRANILAIDKVLYHGHAVAAVAATSLQVAEEAVRLIEVDYEVLPPVLDVVQAMREEAPVLLPSLRTDELGQKSERPNNIASHVRMQRGDPQQAFREAAVVVDREFRTSTVHQGYLEPQTATGLWNSDGQITIWTSTQGIHNQRQQIAGILAMPATRIKMVPMEVGGAFGGKIRVYLEPLAALLSRQSGYRPVKLVMTYAEVLQATGPTSGSYIRVKIGANAAGCITAAEATLAYDAGALPGSPVLDGAGILLSPYKIENFQIDAYDVVVNKPQTGAYRAPGSANANFAAESVIDEVCEKLGMDPIEFRLRNAVQQGDRRIDGTVCGRVGLVETLLAIREHPHYQTPLTGKYRGRGVASAFWFNWGGRSSVTAAVNPDGGVSLVIGAADLSGSRVALAMVLAETLGIHLQAVKPVLGDSDAVGYCDQTSGSRTAFSSGLAVYEVGQKLIQEMAARLGEYWGVPPAEVVFQDGIFAAGAERMTFAQAAAQVTGQCPIVAAISVHPQVVSPAFATHVADVEVDPETGKVTILRYTAAQDVGRALHRSNVEGQMQGGVAQGVGWALYEGYVYSAEGRLLNCNLLDYRMPTALDLPMIDAVVVEVPNPDHPLGVRGAGEIPIVPVPAAIANAIHDALGSRLGMLPMSPARILEAIGVGQPTQPEVG